MTGTPTAPNAELAYAVLDQIDAHPESWSQGNWDCGTAACFAGWAVRLSGATSDGSVVVAGPEHLLGMTVEEAAKSVLDVTENDCWTEPRRDKEYWLFGPDADREDLGRMVTEIFGPRPAGDVR